MWPTLTGASASSNVDDRNETDAEIPVHRRGCHTLDLEETNTLLDELVLKTVDEVCAWLVAQGFERWVIAFRENEIDGAILATLDEADLEKLGLPLGPRRKLHRVLSGAAEAASPLPARSAERRQLTVMLVDLVGSTALSSQLDPEDMREVIRAYQNTVAGEVSRLEGHVAKFMGDGVLCYFGWPRAHEDEAERAVRAGLAIVTAVAKLTGGGQALACRVGIATGLVVVGDVVGEGSSREETVVGDTPNVAARLQAIAPPAAVVIATSTRRLLGTTFELEDLGPQLLKGFVGTIGAWRVQGEHAVDSRFEARSTGPTPLVGREEEVALLVERWHQAQHGEGQVVLLSGEPGIGKSRITRALYERLDGVPHLRLRHQCSPYYVDTPLRPLVEHFEQAAGFQPDDQPAAKLGKLEALLAEGTERTSTATPLIAAILSIPLDGCYPPLTGPPQQQREATIEALAERVTDLARRQPVLTVFEDLHWADPTTLELLDRLIGRIAGERVLVLLTSRPDFSPPWKCRPHATLISLNRLPRRQSAALAAAVAGEHGLPDTVLHEIVARADGVPLFIEELTKTVVETAGDTMMPDGGRHRTAGTTQRPAIPATLQDSLMARLDRLAGSKELAQIGATIGREFGYELLAAVSELAESELREGLGQLVASELVFVRGAPPAATYTFKHALVQDVAYASLLRTRRQQLHARIARELEERWPETQQLRPELLAYHFAEADLPQKAAAYGLEAGRSSFGRSAAAEAAVHLQRALDLLSRLPDDESRRRLELDLQITLGHALIATKSPSEKFRLLIRGLPACA